MSNRHSGKKTWHCFVGKPRPKSKLRCRANKEKTRIRRAERQAIITKETGIKFN